MLVVSPVSKPYARAFVLYMYVKVVYIHVKGDYMRVNVPYIRVIIVYTHVRDVYIHVRNVYIRVKNVYADVNRLSCGISTPLSGRLKAWKCEADLRAVADFGFEEDLSAVLLDDLTDEGEAQPR
jgi:hypothetical protein